MRTSLARACCLAGALACAASALAASAVVDGSHVESNGTRTMELSIDVPASASDVWAALTTAEGWRGWAAPVAHVDFRLGGVIETSYNPAAPAGAPGNIRNEILAFVPQRMFAIRNIQAPPGTTFDVPTFQSLHTVILVEPVTPARTRVSFIQPGYRAGEPWDTVYKHFAWGNAWTLEQLKTRFEEGPIDWRKRAEQAAARK
ncbi:MAG: SRPBCC family protein [Burkholderiaceae bacterium]